MLSSTSSVVYHVLNANMYKESQHCNKSVHYDDVIMGAIASQITSLTIIFSTVYLDTDHKKHQSAASLAFVRGIHRRPVNSPHKWPVTRKMIPFDDVIMNVHYIPSYMGRIIWPVICWICFSETDTYHREFRDNKCSHNTPIRERWGVYIVKSRFKYDVMSLLQYIGTDCSVILNRNIWWTIC